MPKTHHLPTSARTSPGTSATSRSSTIDSGDTVVVWTRDVSDNQIGPDSDTSVIASLDWDRVYPLAGPIAVKGAEPGDTLDDRDPRHPHAGAGAGRRSSRPRPAAGRLPRRLPAHLRSLARRRRLLPRGHRDPADALLRHDGRVPGRRQRGGGDAARHVRRQHGHSPARRGLDAVPARCRSRTRCSRCGDAHGCQGDGEVCVTGIESPMFASLRFTLEKGRSMPAPQYRRRRR